MYMYKGKIKFDLHNVHLKINNLTVLGNSEQSRISYITHSTCLKT